MAVDVHAPWMFRADRNADARSPLHACYNEPAILNEQAIAQEVIRVFFQRDTERHRQVARTTAKTRIIQESFENSPAFGSAAATPPHYGHTIDRFERPKEHRR